MKTSTKKRIAIVSSAIVLVLIVIFALRSCGGSSAEQQALRERVQHQPVDPAAQATACAQHPGAPECKKDGGASAPPTVRDNKGEAPTTALKLINELPPKKTVTDINNFVLTVDFGKKSKSIKALVGVLDAFKSEGHGAKPTIFVQIPPIPQPEEPKKGSKEAAKTEEAPKKPDPKLKKEVIPVYKRIAAEGDFGLLPMDDDDCKAAIAEGVKDALFKGCGVPDSLLRLKASGIPAPTIFRFPFPQAAKIQPAQLVEFAKAGIQAVVGPGEDLSAGNNTADEMVEGWKNHVLLGNVIFRLDLVDGDKVAQAVKKVFTGMGPWNVGEGAKKFGQMKHSGLGEVLGLRPPTATVQVDPSILDGFWPKHEAKKAEKSADAAPAAATDAGTTPPPAASTPPPPATTATPPVDEDELRERKALAELELLDLVLNRARRRDGGGGTTKP